MGLYDDYRTIDQIEYEPSPGVIFHLRRAGDSNKKFVKALERTSRKLRGTKNPDAQSAILGRVFAETVVVGWENVTDAQGNSIEYSVEACQKLFQDLPDLLRDIVSVSNDKDMFLASHAPSEFDVKN